MIHIATCAFCSTTTLCVDCVNDGKVGAVCEKCLSWLFECEKNEMSSDASTAIATVNAYMAAQNVTLPVDGLVTYYKARTHLKMKFDDMSDLSFEPTQDDLAEMSDRTMGKLPWDRKEESE